MCARGGNGDDLRKKLREFSDYKPQKFKSLTDGSLEDDMTPNEEENKVNAEEDSE